MFKFIIKKGLYNLVLNAYSSQLYIYKNEVLKILSSIPEEATDDEFDKLHYKATQKYYSGVFDFVCQEIGRNISNFKYMLPLKLGAFDFDPDNLAAGQIYDFAFWCLTNKRANPKKCIEINHYVYNLKNQCLLEIDKSQN